VRLLLLAAAAAVVVVRRRSRTQAAPDLWQRASDEADRRVR
jgi:hypothetical protein